MKELNLPGDLTRAQQVWFEGCLYQILDAAINADCAMMGNIQLFNRNQNALRIVVQRGFDMIFLQHFGSVRDHDGSVCGRAFIEKRRVMISDVHFDESFSSHRSIARASGFRAVAVDACL